MTTDKGSRPAGEAASDSPPGAGRGAGQPAARGPASPIEYGLAPASGVPTYLQLVQQVEHALRLGYLKPGDQLPKVRDVVAALAINPNTVLKAYRELETKCLTAGRPRQGGPGRRRDRGAVYQRAAGISWPWRGGRRDGGRGVNVIEASGLGKRYGG